MSPSAFPDSASSGRAFPDLCAVYDGLLSGEDPLLSDAAQTDLRAFARLYDLALETANEAEVWRQVRVRLQQDLSRPLQTTDEWRYEGQARAA